VRHDQTPAYYDQIVGDVVLNGSAQDARNIEVLPELAALPPAGPRPDSAATDSVTTAPIAEFSRGNSDWSVYFSFADPVTAISWRLGESGPFRETGFLDSFDPRTRKRMANPTIVLPPDTPATTIYVQYIDVNGNSVGPFPIRFEPRAAMERGFKKILNGLSSWVELRLDYHRQTVVEFGSLMTWRCAIREVRFGVDTPVPDRTFALPPCDMKNPTETPYGAVSTLKVAPTTKSVSVQLIYADGTTSELMTAHR
jgi:hypothetical protein